MVIFRKPVAGLSAIALERFVTRASNAVRLRGSTNVMVTTSQEMRSLNRRFRGKDKPTDVLSFPPLLDEDAKFAGDVAISGDIASRNAKLLGHSPADEIKVLALHGIVHLAGFDHEHDSGEMARREQRLRKSLGLPVGLMERNGEPGKGMASPLNAKSRSKQKPASIRRDKKR